MQDVILQGQFETLASQFPQQSVDLLVTSPPYAMQRSKQYGGIPELDYPQWTVNWLAHALPLLKPTASVVIVIRPHVTNGQISDYMLHTRLAIRAAGWLELDEWIWHKVSSPPLGNVQRPRRAWESLHWFARSPKPFCDAKAMGAHSERIGFHPTQNNRSIYHGETVESTGIARSTDFISIPDTDTSSDIVPAMIGHPHDAAPFNHHPAKFPLALVTHLANTLCPTHGTLLDPFMGSGTTALAAIRANRHYFGTEMHQEYVDIANQRIKQTVLCPSADDLFTWAAK